MGASIGRIFQMVPIEIPENFRYPSKWYQSKYGNLLGIYKKYKIFFIGSGSFNKYSKNKLGIKLCLTIMGLTLVLSFPVSFRIRILNENSKFMPIDFSTKGLNMNSRVILLLPISFHL
jgi:hypothetical protein